MTMLPSRLSPEDYRLLLHFARFRISKKSPWGVETEFDVELDPAYGTKIRNPDPEELPLELPSPDTPASPPTEEEILSFTTFFAACGAYVEVMDWYGGDVALIPGNLNLQRLAVAALLQGDQPVASQLALEVLRRLEEGEMANADYFPWDGEFSITLLKVTKVLMRLGDKAAVRRGRKRLRQFMRVPGNMIGNWNAVALACDLNFWPELRRIMMGQQSYRIAMGSLPIYARMIDAFLDARRTDALFMLIGMAQQDRDAQIFRELAVKGAAQRGNYDLAVSLTRPRDHEMKLDTTYVDAIVEGMIAGDRLSDWANVLKIMQSGWFWDEYYTYFLMRVAAAAPRALQLPIAQKIFDHLSATGTEKTEKTLILSALKALYNANGGFMEQAIAWLPHDLGKVPAWIKEELKQAAVQFGNMDLLHRLLPGLQSGAWIDQLHLELLRMRTGQPDQLRATFEAVCAQAAAGDSDLRHKLYWFVAREWHDREALELYLSKAAGLFLRNAQYLFRKLPASERLLPIYRALGNMDQEDAWEFALGSDLFEATIRERLGIAEAWQRF